MKIETVLMDVDGTMTGCYPGKQTHSPMHLLEELVMKRYGTARAQASARILACGDCNTHCLSEFLGQLQIPAEAYFRVLCDDLKNCLFIPEDTKTFFRFLRNKGIRLFTATTNSEFMTRAKLSAGGVEADAEKCEWFAGYYSGCFFGDPEGKFSPDFYPAIMRHGKFDPETTMMVGDEPRRDMEPAMRAGIRYGVNIDRQQTEAVLQKDCGYFINSLTVLQSLIN